MKIAIDGPSGAGKSTIAKAVARRLQIDYIDTGAMYRAIGLKMTRLGMPMEESSQLQTMLDETDIDFHAGNVILDGEKCGDYMTDFVCTKIDGELMVRECISRKLLSRPQMA